MNRYIFNIKQNFGGDIDDQNVWTIARSKQAAINEIKREYHSIVDITLIRVEDL